MKLWKNFTMGEKKWIFSLEQEHIQSNLQGN